MEDLVTRYRAPPPYCIFKITPDLLPYDACRYVPSFGQFQFRPQPHAADLVPFTEQVEAIGTLIKQGKVSCCPSVVHMHQAGQGKLLPL